MGMEIKVSKDLDTIIEILTQRFDGNSKAAMNWLFEPQEEIMGETPIKLINAGNTDFILKYLQGYRRDVPS